MTPVRALAARDAPPCGNADAWDRVNHVDERYLEISVEPDFFRTFGLWSGLLLSLPAVFSLWGGVMTVSREEWWPLSICFIVGTPFALIAVFLIRFAIWVPEDRIARFNRRQRRLYVNGFVWNFNPFGRWRPTAKVFEWDRLDAEVVRHTHSNDNDEIIESYALELVARDPRTGDEIDRLSLRRSAQTAHQLEEQWEYVRRYMSEGPVALPPQTLHEPETPADRLFVLMPWLAPSPGGRVIRERMGSGSWLFAALVSWLLPLSLMVGACHVVLMGVAPAAQWPKGMDEASRA